MVLEVHLAPNEESCAHVLLIAPCAVFEDCDGVIGGPSWLIAVGNELLQFFFIAHILVVRPLAVAPLIRKAGKKDRAPVRGQDVKSIHRVSDPKKGSAGFGLTRRSRLPRHLI